MIEVNISCPNVENRGQVFACDADRVRRGSIGAVRRAATRRARVRQALAGRHRHHADRPRRARCRRRRVLADQHTAGHGRSTWTPCAALGGVTGGLSGPAIRPVAVRCVWQVRRALPASADPRHGRDPHRGDALEFILAGAAAVSVGTAVFGDPDRTGASADRADRRARRARFRRGGRRRRLRPPTGRAARCSTCRSWRGMNSGRRSARAWSRRWTSAVRCA